MAEYKRKHIIADLKPYVCVFDQCSADVTLFDSETEWQTHECWSHKFIWSCDGFEHPPMTFPDVASFKEHASLTHLEVVNSISLDRLAEICARPVASPIEQSPFCSRSDTSKGASTKCEREDRCPLESHERETVDKHVLRDLIDLFLLELVDDEVDNWAIY